MAVARERTQLDVSQMAMNNHVDEEGAQLSAVINFKSSSAITHTHTHGYDHSNVLSFEHQKPHDEYWMWDDNLITDHHHPSSSDDFTSCSKDGSLGWLYSDPTTHHFIHDSTPDFSFLHKRPHLGENPNIQISKKQCMAKSKQKPKERSTSGTTSTSTSSVLASKDPQSIAAKNRRERISERLKVLQELVPNGTKVDLVTMLEKAIGYVKFLQLQVKVLGTDEFWPVQGGKAPDISQVKEAIDAILSSQRDSRNSSSSSKS